MSVLNLILFVLFYAGREPVTSTDQFSDDIGWIMENIQEKVIGSEESLVIFHSVEYYLKSAERYEWSDEIPEDIRKRYVLYPRLSQEPLEDYRPFFYDILADSLDTCQNSASAAETIFRWSSSVLKFKQTSRRDQGPLETYYSGYGRCEELMIFSASVCRTFGIPARQVYVPYWSFTDNNHAWTEVFVGGEWHYIDEGAVLDETWFSDYLEKTALVLAVSPGRPENEDIVREYHDASLINRTRNYAPSGVLLFIVTEDGEPAESARVSVCVYNWGALREIAGGFTGKDGLYSLTLGLVSVFAFSEKKGKTAFGIYTPLDSDTVRCLLDLGTYSWTDTSFFLRIK
ncbi:hypothetical protein JXL83_09485 [candidate division WOR-3 bacterium]|nr:hypothetical protein [candidate division WOR-3 bacterium]